MPILLLVLDDSSSDDDDDNDDEFIDFIFNELGPLRKKPRIQNYVEDVVVQYNEEEFRENFR